MKKKFLLLTLFLLLVAMVRPQKADAAPYYNIDLYHFEWLQGIWVNGEDLSAGGTISCGNGTATLDKSSSPYKLTLTNAEITGWKVEGDYGLGIVSDTPLEIVLKGSNTIKIKRSDFIIGIGAPSLTFNGSGSLSMDLNVTDVHIGVDDYLSLYVMNAVGIYAEQVTIYDGQYNLDCADDVNYISHAIRTDYLRIVKGRFSLFGSGGAFSKTPSFSKVSGDAYPVFSKYSTVSAVKVGKGASHCSAADKKKLDEYNKYVTFNVSAHCDTVELLSASSPVIGHKVSDESKVSPLGFMGEIQVDSVAWFEKTKPDVKLSTASKFESGKKYTMTVYLSSCVDGMLDSDTKCPAAKGKVTYNGKMLKLQGKDVYMLEITSPAVTSTEANVWVNGNRLAFDYPGKDAIEFDRNENTIYLDNVSISGSSHIAEDFFNGNAVIYSEEDLTIVLKGSNVITIPQQAARGHNYAIAGGGKITICGTGSLTINSMSEDSIGMEASQLEIADGCKVDITAETGISAAYDLINNGELHICASNTGIFLESGDLINNGNVYASGSSTAIHLFHGTLKMSSAQKLLGSTKAGDELANLTDATWVKDYSRADLKSSGKEAFTVFVGILGHTHVFNQKVESDEYLASVPVCTKNTLYYYSCICGEKDLNGKTFQSAQKGEHSFKEENTDAKYLKSEADCKSPAVYYYKCENCEEHGTLTFTYGEIGEHAFGDDDICDTCGLVKKPDHTHTGLLVKKVDATCEKEGMQAYYVCSCGKMFRDVACTKEITDPSQLVIGKINHIAGEIIIDKKPEIGMEGHSHTECIMCGIHMDETDMPALKQSHTHSGKKVAKVEPTCEKEGCQEYYICSCGSYFADSACTKEITDLKTLKIAKIDHIISDWIIEKEAGVGVEGRRFKECTMCHEEFDEEFIPALTKECEHIFTEQRGGKEATCTEEGYTGDLYCFDCNKLLKAGTVIPKKEHTYNGEGICTVCGANKAEEDPQGGDPQQGENQQGENPQGEDPQQGDNTDTKKKETAGNIGLYVLIAVLLATIIAVIVILLLKKKKSANKEEEKPEE